MSNKVVEVTDPKTKVITHHLKNKSGKTLAILEENANEELNDINNGKVEDYVSARYTNENGDEFEVIFNENGNLIKKGVFIQSFIKKRNEFIITTNHSGDDTLYNSWGGNLDELFAVIDNNGDYIIEPQKDNIEYIEQLDLYLSNSKRYYDGNDYIGDVNDKIELGNIISFSKENKIGLIGINGVILEAICDDVIETDEENCLLIRKENKYALFNITSQKLSEFIYDSICIGTIGIREGNRTELGFFAKKNNLIGMIDVNENILIDFYYDSFQLIQLEHTDSIAYLSFRKDQNLYQIHLFGYGSLDFFTPLISNSSQEETMSLFKEYLVNNIVLEPIDWN